MKLVHAPLVMAVISALVNVASPKPTTSLTTPGPHGLNLNGKMFTLSSDSGGISFYPPSWPYTPSYITSPYDTNTPPYTTERPYPTTTHYPTTTERPDPSTTHYPTTTKRPDPTNTHYPTTTALSTRGVSVCLRYLTDYVQTIFTLSPSSSPVQLSDNGLGYTLTFNSYDTLSFTSSTRYWSNIGPDIWSRVCLTLDSMKNVAQVFSGSNVSIRKLISDQYVWSGEPVIEFTDFDGQVTDVQMWDYPLSYRDVVNYMTSGVHGPYRGSVLTWSSISYSPRGDALLEDVSELQAKQQISSRRRGRPKGSKKTRKF
ncbi:uncharacterized protein [Pagrus major]|uniref:uncharacterized protein n=1 Tax=Pagrus major TaxID=143350 RepID=UPI003CC8BFA0